MTTGHQPNRDGHDMRLQVWGRFTSGLLALLGILGLLRVGLSGPADTVTVLVVHPISALIYLLAGLAGIALVAGAAGQRLFARIGGAGLMLWGLLGLVLRGSPSEVFSGDRETVAFHLILGLAGVTLALLRPRSSTNAGEAT